MAEQLALRVDPLADVIAENERQPEVWAAIVAWAHHDHECGKRPSTRTYACVLRDPQMAAVLGLERRFHSPVLVNDHWTSGWARLLNRLYPYLDVPCRKAKVDGWGAVGGEAS